MFWNLLPYLLIRKENPGPKHPAFPLGWWEMPGWITYFVIRALTPAALLTINVPHSWKAGLVSLFPSSECIPTAPVGSTLQFSVSASLISNFNCFVTPFSNLPTSTLSNILQPSFVANGFAPTQERTVLCCKWGLTTADTYAAWQERACD